MNRSRSGMGESGSVINGSSVTIRDVARQAGVSVATVSNALRGKGKMREETRRRVVETARRMGFRPRKRGPGAGRRQKSVVVLVEKQSGDPERDAFVGAILHGIARGVMVRGGLLRTRVVGAEMVREGELPPELFHPQTVGVIVLEGGDLTDSYIMKINSEVGRSGLPVLLVDNVNYHLPMHSITADNLTGGYLAATHLIEMGHRRIGVLRGPWKYKPLAERYFGFLQAMEARDLPVEPELAPPPISGEAMKGYGQMRSLLELPEPPTAVFAVSDKTAIGALAAARDLGVRVPEDVAVVGFDDVAEAAVQSPALTTVAVPREELGRMAAEKLLDLVDFPGQPPMRISMPVRIVVRESCGIRRRAKGRKGEGTNV